MDFIDEITNLLNRLYDEMSNCYEVSFEINIPQNKEIDEKYYIKKYDLDQEKYETMVKKLSNVMYQKDNFEFISFLSKTAPVSTISKSSKAIMVKAEDLPKYIKAYVLATLAEEKCNLINEQKRTTKKEIKKSIRNIRNLIQNLSKHNIKNINIQEEISRIKESNLLDVDKNELIKKLNDYIQLSKKKEKKVKEEVKEKDDRLEEVIKNEQNSSLSDEDKFINNICILMEEYPPFSNIIQRYGHLIPEGAEYKVSDNVFGYNELKEISSFSVNEIDEEIFSNVCASVIAILNKKNQSQEILPIFENICSKYEYNTILEELDNLIIRLWKNYKPSSLDSSELTRYQDIIQDNKTIKVVRKEDLKQLEDIKTNLYRIRKNYIVPDNSQEERIPIRSFVLFDGKRNQDVEFIPYVVSDLDENSSNNQIDLSVDRSKIITDGYVDFNNLIEDLIVYGKPKIILDGTDKINKFIRPVYNLGSKHDAIDTRMKNATGIVRIRPGMNTYVRFFDEKFELIPNMPKMKQMKELIERKLPGATIDEDKPFGIFINYLDAFKSKSLSSYKDSIQRQSSSEIRKVFANKKEKFDSFELKLLEEYIDATKEAYNNLTMINSNFDFSLIDKLSSKQKII